MNPGGLYIDATFGRGGHADAIVQRLDNSGQLIVLDRDPTAVATARERYGSESRVTTIHSGFGDLEGAVAALNIEKGTVDGLLFDLGVSSPQLNTASRGFSFMADGPLDMRMDTSAGESAAEWLNRVEEKELRKVLTNLGEERFARRVARRIVDNLPITTTAELARVVEGAIPKRERGRHRATRSFQAIRMQVNDELGQLSRALPQAFNLLRQFGRMAVISFHSLEDRMVKNFARELSRRDDFPPDMPIRHVETAARARVVGGLGRPSAQEVETNPRARSARLRCIEKLEPTGA